MPFTFNFSRMINAGYVGRDQEVVRKYIAELEAKGIPGPKSTPALFPVNPRALVINEDIEVYGAQTAGEVEYVLLIQDAQTIFVGMGSDHTGRLLEETDIPRSTISAVLAGRRQISKVNVMKLADYFGVSPSVFLGQAQSR